MPSRSPDRHQILCKCGRRSCVASTSLRRSWLAAVPNTNGLALGDPAPCAHLHDAVADHWHVQAIDQSKAPFAAISFSARDSVAGHPPAPMDLQSVDLRIASCSGMSSRCELSRVRARIDRPGPRHGIRAPSFLQTDRCCWCRWRSHQGPYRSPPGRTSG